MTGNGRSASGLKAIHRPLAGFAMLALIGDFGQPLPRLAIHIVQIGELAQRPEVLAEIADGAFDFAFFPAAGRIAGARVEAVFASEAEEAREKTDQATIMFGDSGGQVVVDDLACDTAQRGESVNVAADEGFEALAVSELDVEHAAVRVDQREGIQLAHVAGIIERAEVAPVDFEAFAGERFHAHEGAVGRELRTNLAHILPQDAVSRRDSRAGAVAVR